MTAVEVIKGSPRESSTRAAREYVEAVRLRLDIEARRHGDAVARSRYYQRLQHSITPESLRQTWPDADIDAVLGE